MTYLSIDHSKKGLRNVRFLVSGAALIGKELLEWFSAIEFQFLKVLG